MNTIFNIEFEMANFKKIDNRNVGYGIHFDWETWMIWMYFNPYVFYIYFPFNRGKFEEKYKQYTDDRYDIKMTYSWFKIYKHFLPCGRDKYFNLGFRFHENKILFWNYIIIMNKNLTK